MTKKEKQNAISKQKHRQKDVILRQKKNRQKRLSTFNGLLQERKNRFVCNYKHLNLSKKELYTLFDMQQKRKICAICRMKRGKKALSLDHCHITLKPRGFLCSDCNFALGLFKDSPKFLAAAIKYLKKS